MICRCSKLIRIKKSKKPYGIFSSNKEKTAFRRQIGFFRKARGIASIALFVVLLVLLIPFLRLLSLFEEKSERKNIWRKAAVAAIKYYFFIGGLKLEIEGKKNIHGGKPAVYIANHLSDIDGLLMIYILGPDVTPVTAPADYFLFPFSYWFKKMEYIDVQRNNIETIKYKTSLSPARAVKKAVCELREDHSLIIFPEGHLEIQKRLLYFHSGAARIALASVKKAIPVGIIDIDKIAIKKFIFASGTIKIIFGDPIDLVDYYVKHIATIKETSLKLMKEVEDLLPRKYFPLGYGEKRPEKTAVFMNIDNTVYNGNAQKDFIIFLLRKGLIEITSFFIVVYLFVLKKIAMISDVDFINVLISMLKGWRAERLYKLSKSFFNKEAKYRVYEKMRTIIKDHQEKGHQIILVTKMVAPLAKCFADYIEADHWISICLEESKLKYTGRLLGRFVLEDKARQILKIKKILNFKLEQSFAYGHDEDDLPMLKLVKYKTLVNPDDQLKAYGKKRGYEILEI